MPQHRALRDTFFGALLYSPDVYETLNDHFANFSGRNRISADQNCFVPADREVSYITTMWLSTLDCHEALSLPAIESLFC